MSLFCRPVAATLLLLAITACAADPVAESEHYLDLSDDPMEASATELTTVEGETWTFTDVADDRLTLLYFGYTSCPDVCPMTMAEINLALQEEGVDDDAYDVVMVTTDPARDTDEQLRTWLDRFNPEFQGIRGDIDHVVDAANDYGIAVDPPVETEGEYLVTHGGRITVLTPDGKAAGSFDEGINADQLAELLPTLQDDLL